MIIDELNRALLPKTKEEFIALMKSKANWFIRTEDDFTQFISSSKSPLVKLDKEIVEEFRRTLIFRNGGLAGANYAMLNNKLSDEEFRILWAYFGISDELYRGYNNKECDEPGSCGPQDYHVCTDNC